MRPHRRRAVRIRRQLAAQHPDAFLPDLATSLGAKGFVLLQMGDWAGAAESFREGVELLKPLFLRLPEAFKPLMANLLGYYSKACEKAETEVDLGLRSYIVPLLSDDTEDAAKA